MDKMRAPRNFYFSPIACELRAELLRYRDESVICRTSSPVTASTVARLETSEQTAHGIADLVTESFAADEVAVDMWNAGNARWRVSIHFRASPDQDSRLVDVNSIVRDGQLCKNGILSVRMIWMMSV